MDSKIVPVSSIDRTVGAQKRAEMLHHPCILGGPQQREQNRKSKPTPGVTMMHHATKRGFKDCPKCAPLAHPLKGHRWGTGPKRCPARARRANIPPHFPAPCTATPNNNGASRCATAPPPPKRHKGTYTQARRHLPPARATAGSGGGQQSGRPCDRTPGYSRPVGSGREGSADRG